MKERMTKTSRRMRNIILDNPDGLAKIIDCKTHVYIRISIADGLVGVKKEDVNTWVVFKDYFVVDIEKEWNDELEKYLYTFWIINS